MLVSLVWTRNGCCLSAGESMSATGTFPNRDFDAPWVALSRNARPGHLLSERDYSVGLLTISSSGLAVPFLIASSISSFI